MQGRRWQLSGPHESGQFIHSTIDVGRRLFGTKPAGFDVGHRRPATMTLA
jgi:hypothetical protein